MVNRESTAVRLYLIEEQEPYREVYNLTFRSRASVNLLGVSTRVKTGVISYAVSRLQPDVLLLGPKKLQRNIIEQLYQIHADNSELGIVLLLAFYEAEDVELLRDLALRGKGGMAILLKQSLDEIEQLHRAVLAVSQGQVILDPALATSGCGEKPTCQLLGHLTARQSEILSLLSKGYTNAAIAEALCIDLKTVEHHLNSVYAKLRMEADFSDKHPRVSAARLYLEATAEL